MTGKDKKLNYPIKKTIRISEHQDKNWDPDNIRKLLEGNTSELDTDILKKMIIPFAENKIKVDLEKNEIERIKEIYEKIQIKDKKFDFSVLFDKKES